MSGSWKLAAARGLMRGTQAISVSAAGWLADRMFCTPPRSRVPNNARAILAAAERGWTRSDGHRLAVWRWGKGPAIALMHGWGSRAARLTAHVPALLDRGLSVVAFDAPAHGESSGRLGSGVQAAQALLAIAETTPLAGVIGHSLGAAATLMALDQGLAIERAVFISPPSDIGAYADRFAEVLGLSDAAYGAMRRRTESRLRFRWVDLDLVAMASRRREPLLLLHDRQDDEVRWENGARIARAWPGAVLESTEGLGHHRIAHDPAVAARAAAFMGGQAKPATSSPA